MINLMYLVLTAMLALNISNEILNAFKTIDASIRNSNGLIAGKNDKTYQDFDVNENIEKDRERVKPYNDKAKLVKAKAQEMYDYIDGWKQKIVKASGGMRTDAPKELKSPENIDFTTKLLVEQGGGNEIKKRIVDLRNFMLAQIDDTDKVGRKFLDERIPLRIVDIEKGENNPKGDWSFGTFNNVPVAGAMALFSKMQNDVRASESAIIDYLFTKSQSVPFKFDAIRAVATPRTSYALVGQPLEAEILLAAYNKNVNPRISASSGSVSVKDGVGTWKSTASGLGLQTVRGTVSVDMGDRVESQPYSFQYMVGSTGASMQIDKMNVFYVGVENPITVSAAGYSLEDVSMNIPGATLASNGLGKFNVTVPASLIGKTVEASINAKDGAAVKTVNKSVVRVKRIPDPQAVVGGRAGGSMPINLFKAQDGIIAALNDFVYDAKFQVVSYNFAHQPKRGDGYVEVPNVSGPRFSGNADVTAAIARAKLGDRIYLENIRAKGPDGTTRRINDIIITLN